MAILIDSVLRKSCLRKHCILINIQQFTERRMKTMIGTSECKITTYIDPADALKEIPLNAWEREKEE